MGFGLRTGKYGSYYGSTKDSSQSLSKEQQQVNALYIAKVLSSKGWSLNAIAGLLGNIQAESALNPGRWQSEAVGSSSAGYGLIQWTGSSIHTKWSGLKGQDYSTMDANLDHILAESSSNDSWYKKKDELRALGLTDENTLDLTYKTFATSMASPYDLACIFVFYRERCYVSLYGSPTEKKKLCDTRGGYAQEWYTFLGGKGNFSGGALPGVSFPARDTEEKVQAFIDDLTKVKNTDAGEEEKEYITSYYRNPAGYYTGRYGIPNNSGGTDKWYGNCTAYAYGRFWELADCAKSLTGKASKPTSVLHGDAGSWYPNNEAKKDYNYGLDPKKGAIICFGGGHVAIVEDYTLNADGSGTLVCSESGWKYSPVCYLRTSRKREKDADPAAINNWGGSTNRPFQGFIYPHYDFDLCPGGIGYGAPQIKSVLLTYVTAETIKGQGFLATEGVTSITCSITGKDSKGNGISAEALADIKLEPLTKEPAEDNSDSAENTDQNSGGSSSGSAGGTTGDSSGDATPANNLTIAIDGAQKTFDFQLTGLTPLTTYEITFTAGGGSVVDYSVSVPEPETSGSSTETDE